MDKDILKGNWNQLKGKLKQQWGKLTDDDIAELSGAREELLGKLQEVYGWQKEESEKQLKKFLEANSIKEKETAKW